MGRQTVGLGYNKITLDFVNCMMEKAAKVDEFTDVTKECATNAQVPILAQVLNCVNHITGKEYLANIGKITNDFQKPLKSVPTIVFNRNYKREDSDNAQSNFIKTLCQYIEGERPTECTTNGVGRSVALSMGSILFLAVAFLLK